MHKIQVFCHTRQISGFPCVTLYINSDVAVQRCYIIITFGVELVKLGNECLQLYEHTTTMFLARLQYFHKIKFNLTKLVTINHALNKVTEKKRLLLQSVKYMEACVTTPD